jgi:outer membrane protein OmpA-like peptidoglycan-associated protein
LGLAVVLFSGCATKKYVRTEVETLKTRVDEVQGQVEENQTAVRDHDEKIGAQGQILDEQGREIQATSKTAQDALNRATAAGKLAEGKLLYEVALTDDKVRFGFDKAELSDTARQALDEFAAQLREENRNVYVEIQGHTDATGSETYNYDLGLERAEAVRRYLNAKGGIPLHRMSVISYGELEPTSDNKTREGRSQNRRVMLVVLE